MHLHNLSANIQNADSLNIGLTCTSIYLLSCLLPGSSFLLVLVPGVAVAGFVHLLIARLVHMFNFKMFFLLSRIFLINHNFQHIQNYYFIIYMLIF